MILANFHTHTHYCDGKNPPEALVQQAIALGFQALGFSGHAHNDVEDCSMTLENQVAYQTEVNRLKVKYANQIQIFCGIEKDYYSDATRDGFDYLISSVHFLEKDGNYLPIDLSPEAQATHIARFYHGDFDAYAAEYFGLVTKAVKRDLPDLIGHLDLVMKFCEVNGYRQSDAYLQSAEACIQALAPLQIPFEINTGAMARGRRTAPYPSKELLQMLKQYGAKVVISSDCHDMTKLDFAFQEAESLALSCGLTPILPNFAKKSTFQSGISML